MQGVVRGVSAQEVWPPSAWSHEAERWTKRKGRQMGGEVGRSHVQGLMFGTTLMPALWKTATMPLKSGYRFLFMVKT